MAKKRFVYAFEEGDGKNKQLLGGKGANLCEMTQIGLPVPPGFVITTEACLAYFEADNRLPDGLLDEVEKSMKDLEKKTAKGLGDPKNPLLVSVRSGAAMSMPGMMDTILNLGLNDETVVGLAKLTDNERFAYDSYRRLLQLFGKVALRIDDEHFDAVFEAEKKRAKAPQDKDLKPESLKKIVNEFKKTIKDHTGKEFPQDPKETAQGRRGSGLFFLDGQAGRGLPKAVQDHAGNGQRHRREYLYHGVRQHGRRFGNGCGIHPKSRNG